MFKNLSLFGTPKKVKKKKKQSADVQQSTLLAQDVSAPTSNIDFLSRASISRVEDFCPINKLDACTIVRRLEDDLRHIQELTKVGFWKYNMTTKDLEWSDQTYEIFERNKNFPLTYNTFLGYVHPEDRDYVKTAFANAVESGNKYDITHRIVIDSKVKWVRERAHVTQQDGVQQDFVIGTVQDITEKKMSEETYRRMSLIFTESEEAFMVADSSGDMLEINDSFTRITGYSQDEIRGKNPRILKSGIHNEDFYKDMWHKVHVDGSWSGEVWNKKKSGEIYPEHLKIYAIRDGDGKIQNYIAMFSDITESKKHVDQMQHMAYHDTLTGLPNRAKLNKCIEHALVEASRNKTQCVIAYLDLDGFKQVNDRLGHAAGDILLKEAARRLNKSIRNHDVCARFGGDEFVVLLTNVNDSKESETALARISNTLNKPYMIDDQEVKVTASMGVTVYPDDASDSEILIRHADSAMYKAKQNGKNQIFTFDPDQEQSKMSRNKIKEQLVDALTINSLELYWQPYFDLVSDNIIGAEVLLRWNRNDEIISPVGFIPAIEHDELSIAIGDYVLTHAFRQIEALNARGLDVNINISINLFQRQLLQPDFEFKILKLLDVFPAVRPNQITFEILETVAIEDFELINMIISNLSARGIKFAIDDFGTGYSSLTYFSKIQAHTIKIDRSFISQIEDEGTDHAIIESIIGLSKTFNKTLIAEGIETEEQRKMLLDMGCSIGQGYLFSKAVQFAEFENMLLRQFAINK